MPGIVWLYLRNSLPVLAGSLLAGGLCACSLLTSLPAATNQAIKPGSGSSQPTASPVAGTSVPGTGHASEEQALISLINAYRIENKLPAIPTSSKLTLTAQAHVRDLENNAPHLQKASDGSECNLHSWSAKGSWTPVCYTADHRESEKMWSKPREIAGYIGNGYEIAAQAGSCQKAGCLLEIWKNSPGHNQVMINQGTWSDTTWKAIGAGISGQFAVVWFGKEGD